MADFMCQHAGKLIRTLPPCRSDPRRHRCGRPAMQRHWPRSDARRPARAVGEGRLPPDLAHKACRMPRVPAFRHRYFRIRMRQPALAGIERASGPECRSRGTELALDRQGAPAAPGGRTISAPQTPRPGSATQSPQCSRPMTLGARRAARPGRCGRSGSTSSLVAVASFGSWTSSRASTGFPVLPKPQKPVRRRSSSRSRHTAIRASNCAVGVADAQGMVAPRSTATSWRAAVLPSKNVAVPSATIAFRSRRHSGHRPALRRLASSASPAAQTRDRATTRLPRSSSNSTTAAPDRQASPFA